MAYTPELSMKSSCTLRRISWALGVPMTKGIEFVFDYLPRVAQFEHKSLLLPAGLLKRHDFKDIRGCPV